MIDQYAVPAKELKAVAHPIRLAILAAFEAGYRSPMEVFMVLNRTDPQLNLALVSYHTQILREQRMIKEVATEKVRGATRHIYKVMPVGTMLLQVADTLLKEAA